MRWKVFLILSLIALGSWSWWYGNKQRKLVVFCDVGQGDGAIIVEGDWEMIVDTGRANGMMKECLSRYMPFWDKEIEVAVISHWDEDHSGGLKDLQQYYKISNIFSGTPPNGDFEQINYSGSLSQGDILRAGELLFEVKLPLVKNTTFGNNENEVSLVGLLQYGIYEILFTGDMTGEEEEYLGWRGLIEGRNKVVGARRILKVSHHGSKESTTEALLERWQPETAVISVGKNSFGHPSQKVIERLEQKKVNIVRTDQQGEVVFSWQ